MTLSLQDRRGTYVEMGSAQYGAAPALSDEEIASFEALDLAYRALCAILYNYAPMSGHPGGSISSGRFVQLLLFDSLDYDLGDPGREDADVLSYAAGHKALGLYALWALRNEVARIAAPALLPGDRRRQLRLEDLLGFRKNPVQRTPLVERFGAKALDGHPTPATPFVRLATGASGVGVASSIGLALAARDVYGPNAPRVHVVEGEGGLTPGRVAEALAAAGTASLSNLVVHVDWNQASIDSERVCQDGGQPGDYVQWTPMELFALHDWNVLYVDDGTDLQQIAAAQRRVRTMASTQPTAIVYRTTKGWRYGIEGRASHGAGHKLCSPGFHATLAELEAVGRGRLPACGGEPPPCANEPRRLEACFWDALGLVRHALEGQPELAKALARRLERARDRLADSGRRPRAGAPRLEAVYEAAHRGLGETPAALQLQPGSQTALRVELGRVLGHLSTLSGGALLTAAADLLGSTSVNLAGGGFPPGFWNAATNPEARLLATGGICEDAMAGILAGVSTFGHHLGVGSSYGAFLAPLGHIAARLHAIGVQARRAIAPDACYDPFVLVCAHAGLKTGEDGPTHADPQPLQLLQENFPPGTVVTLTPWDPQELWPLMCAALARRPALIAPFVTRPNERVLDRAALGLAPPCAATDGVYLLRPGKTPHPITVVLQGSAVTYAFLTGALPLLERDGIDVEAYSIASVELFDALAEADRRRVFPEAKARAAIGITDFTLATMYRWITSDRGRAATLHPFKRGHFLGSGPGGQVLAEAGLDGPSQAEAIRAFAGDV